MQIIPVSSCEALIERHPKGLAALPVQYLIFFSSPFYFYHERFSYCFPIGKQLSFSRKIPILRIKKLVAAPRQKVNKKHWMLRPHTRRQGIQALWFGFFKVGLVVVTGSGSFRSRLKKKQASSNLKWNSGAEECFLHLTSCSSSSELNIFSRSLKDTTKSSSWMKLVEAEGLQLDWPWPSAKWNRLQGNVKQGHSEYLV